ncbi:hypothetical protein SAMN05660462_02471 [Proteiniborus ethanoligenes]|uniref:Uncharacterized protein n=1 Tax=Proteiniborus ethanoligenes TaxID=415015 RepID=A0A1H3RN19_9FIRM|nr:hypothetical protein [Proteiniborus ethanoligenes]SDZ27122.1 hypothetical protein SAMN05660462_02471 [Proteiniborus ethanoligenes]
MTKRYSSKYHEANKCYWFGISPGSLENIKSSKDQYIEFEMKHECIIEVPVEIILEYTKIANTRKDKSGNIKHYQIYIRKEPRIQLFKNDKTWELEKYLIG